MRLQEKNNDCGSYRPCSIPTTGLNKKAPPSKRGYHPIHYWKIAAVKKAVAGLPKGSRILDAGCGNGFMMDELDSMLLGFDVWGLDLHNKGEKIVNKSITGTGFSKGCFDCVLCLEILQYLPKNEIWKALAEVKRISKKRALIIITFPNQTHFAARAVKLLKRQFPPTDTKVPSVGDMPISEFEGMLKRSGFAILEKNHCFPTFLPLSLFLPLQLSRALLPLANRLASQNDCFVTLFICRKSAKKS